MQNVVKTATGTFFQKINHKKDKTYPHVWDADKFSFKLKARPSLANSGYEFDWDVLIRLHAEAYGQNINLLEDFDWGQRTKFYASGKARNQDFSERGRTWTKS